MPSGCMMAELGKLGSPQGGWEALYRLLSRVPFFNPIQSKGGVWSAPQPKIGSAIVRAPTRSLAGSSSALYPASSLPPRALWCALGPPHCSYNLLKLAQTILPKTGAHFSKRLFQEFWTGDCQRSKRNQNQRSQLGIDQEEDGEREHEDRDRERCSRAAVKHHPPLSESGPPSAIGDEAPQPHVLVETLSPIEVGEPRLTWCRLAL